MAQRHSFTRFSTAGFWHYTTHSRPWFTFRTHCWKFAQFFEFEKDLTVSRLDKIGGYLGAFGAISKFYRCIIRLPWDILLMKLKTGALNISHSWRASADWLHFIWLAGLGPVGVRVPLLIGCISSCGFISFDWLDRPWWDKMRLLIG
jgi:hypothetical protein